MKTTLSDLNHQILERGLGGGYVYEWTLGAELALLALLPEHQTSWLCDRTETPVFHELRQWLGRVERVTLEAQGKNLEDINLFGFNGKVLLIQVKSGKSRLDKHGYLGALARFVNNETVENAESRRYLLIAEDGIVQGRHLRTTLTEFLAKPPDLAKKPEAAKSEYRCDDRTFTDRVYFSRGPSIERLVTGLRDAVERSVSRRSDRKQLLSLTDTFSNRFRERAVTKNAVFTETELKALLDIPTTLDELIQRWNLPTPKKSEHPVYFLNDLLGWELVTAGIDVVGPLVKHASQSHARKSEVGLRRALEDISTSVDFPRAHLADFGDCEIRALCLRRIIAATSGELGGRVLHQRAKEGDETAVGHLWFELGVKITRFDQVVTIRVSGCAGYENLIKQSCRTVIAPYLDGVGAHLISGVLFELGDPIPPPSWMPESDWQDPSCRPQSGEQASSEKEQETSERGISQQLADLEMRVYHGHPTEEVVAPLEVILGRCREQNLLRLALTAGETLAVTLEAIDRSKDARTLRLGLAIDELSQLGSQLPFREHERSFSIITRESDARGWTQVQLGHILMASMRSDFDSATRVCRMVDTAPGRRLDQSDDDLVFDVLLAHAQAAMGSGQVTAALAATRSLLYRLTEDQAEQICETLILLTLCALQTDSREELVSACNLMQSFYPKVEVAQRSSRTELLETLTCYLGWMAAPSEESRKRLQAEWSKLAENLSDKQAWSRFYRLRAYFEYRRGIIHLRPQAQRKASWELADKHRQPDQEAVRRAKNALVEGNLFTSLQEANRAVFLSLRAGEWTAWLEANQLLPRLHLADGRGAEAAQVFILHGVGGPEKDFLTQLVRQFSEQQIEEVVDRALDEESAPRRQRGFALLGRLKELLDDGQRARVITEAERALKVAVNLREEANAHDALFDLVGDLLQCPSDKDEAVRLIRVLLKRYHSQDDPSRRSETLKKVRRTFWTATGLLPPDGALEDLLNALDSVLKAEVCKQDRGLIFDILLAIGMASAVGGRMASRCLSLLQHHDAKTELAEWKARTDTPSQTQAAEALARALATLDERIEHSLGRATSSLRTLSLGDVMPFLEHFNDDEIAKLLGSILSLAADGESESTRRWEALQLLRHPSFHRCPKNLLDKARRLVLDWTEDRVERNLFDKRRSEVNSSRFTGLSMDADHDGRALETAFQALGSLHATAKGPQLDAYFEKIAVQLAGPNPRGARNVSRSLICYFECQGALGPATINQILLSLLQRFDEEDKAAGLTAAGKFVLHGGQPTPTFVSVVQVLAKADLPIAVRKSLASFSRLGIKGEEKRPGKFASFYQELNDQMRGDRSPIVRRFADLSFWRDEV